jgi:hypothetical protein
MILGPLFLSLVTILNCLMEYCRRRRDTYREDDTAHIPSQPRMMIHQWDSVMLELRDTPARRQELQELRPQFHSEVDIFKMTAKPEVQLLSQIGSTRTTEVEEEHPADFQDDVDSARTVEEVDEHNETSQEDVDSVNIVSDRLLLMLTEETVGHQESMESPVKTVKRRKKCTVASNVTGEKEKEVPANKIGVGLPSSPNLEASRAKGVTQSSSCHRRGGSNVKIYNKKENYSKIKAKVDTWRKTQL